MKRHKVLSEHIFEDIYKDIDVDSTTKTIILKSVRKTTVSVGLRQIRKLLYEHPELLVSFVRSPP